MLIDDFGAHCNVLDSQQDAKIIIHKPYNEKTETNMEAEKRHTVHHIFRDI